MGPEALAQVLRPLHNLFPAQDYPDLLVGLGTADDAAVYRLNEHQAIISTTDFFPPVVDDPYIYGAIAAANSMSDVYAMGGEVLLAINIAAFPANLPPEVISTILQGGAEKVAEAGGVLAGGHTMENRQPFYGLAVIGVASPDRIFTKGGAKPGDVLVLSKPLGAGIVTTALKGQVADRADVEAAQRSMMRLNRRASQLLRATHAQAVTDITGFSLLGHAHEMAMASGAGMRFYLERLPFLPGAHRYAEEWLFPAGAHKNQEYYGPWVRFAAGISEEEQLLLFTPETSGGLLAALPSDEVEDFLAACQEAGQPMWVVGEVIEGEGIQVVR